jgi:hypothetical protein
MILSRSKVSRNYVTDCDCFSTGYRRAPKRLLSMAWNARLSTHKTYPRWFLTPTGDKPDKNIVLAVDFAPLSPYCQHFFG